MSAKLPVTVDRTVYGVDVNVNDRIDIYNAAGTAFEIVNSPDEAPEDGGKFPVCNAISTVFLIEYVDVPGPVVNSYVGVSPGDAGQGSAHAS